MRDREIFGGNDFGERIALQPLSEGYAILAFPKRRDDADAHLLPPHPQLVVKGVLHDVIALVLAEVPSRVPEERISEIILSRGCDVGLPFDVMTF